MNGEWESNHSLLTTHYSRFFMQDIMPPLGANAQLVQSYGVDGFRIGNVVYNTHVLALPEATVAWSGDWSLDALAGILTLIPLPEVLLIGTGARHAMIPTAFRAVLKARGIGFDTMDTGAACRTFNILLGESRRVAAALLLPL